MTVNNAPFAPVAPIAAATIVELARPITGNGPLARRYNSENHGLWVGDIMVAIEMEWRAFLDSEEPEEMEAAAMAYDAYVAIARRM